MSGWLMLGLLLILGFLLDRLALKLEARGWIYWRKTSKHAASNATLGPIAEVFAPSHSHVVQEKERQRLEIVQASRDKPELKRAAHKPHVRKDGDEF